MNNTKDTEVDLTLLWKVLKCGRRYILSSVVIFTLLSVAIAFKLPPKYRSQASIIPLSTEQQPSLGSLSGIASVFGLSTTSTSSAVVEAILKSRLLKERVIKKLHLIPLLVKDEQKRDMFHAVKALSKMMSIQSDKKTGLITITVSSKDPKLSQEIASVAINETQKIIEEKNLLVNRVYKNYLESQIKRNQRLLSRLENIYANYMSGKVSRIPLIEPGKLNLYRFSSKVLPRLSVASVPEQKFNEIRLKLDVNILTTLYENLFAAYEKARLQEVRNEVTFQVIDPPSIEPKDEPSSPNKPLIIVGGVFLGLVLGYLFALLKVDWEKQKC